MNVSLRWFAMVVLGVLAGSDLGRTQAQAQRVPIGVAPNPGIAPARGLAGFATATTLAQGAGLSGFGLNGFGINGVGGFGLRGLGAAGFNGLGLAGGALGFGRGLGYGSLAASYAGSGLGYGGLGGVGGAYLGLGYGGLGSYYSGMNTAGLYSGLSGGYQGYLSGSAAITKANAQYHTIIQQGSLLREEARRSRLQTRRAQIEEAEYERAHMPDPEKIRQQQLARALDRARVSPPLTEIWSGDSLNSLLRHLISQQGQGVKGPTMPLDEDMLKSITLTAGDTRGNVGLLKENGALQWPQPLQGEAFKDAREDLSRQMKHAVSTVQVNRAPDESTVNDLQADLKKLSDTLEASVSSLSPDQYIEARRYLRMLNNSVTALKDRNVSNLLNGNWDAKGKSVAELVKFMADKGLRFASATPGNESAYLALYHKLAAFDAGMPRVASTSENPGNGGNGYGDK
jgi:hypothetical protein